MSLIAVSTIQHGNDDGTVKVFNIGDTVSGLTEAQERSLVEAGAVVETGKRKYTEQPSALVVDEETRKRDEIIAKAAAGENLSPAVVAAIDSNSSNAAADADGDNAGANADTMGQAAATAGDKSDSKK